MSRRGGTTASVSFDGQDADRSLKAPSVSALGQGVTPHPLKRVASKHVTTRKARIGVVQFLCGEPGSASRAPGL